MRCLALAQAWQEEGGRAVFAASVMMQLLKARLQSEGIEVVRLSTCRGSDEDAIQTLELARRMKAKWAVVDGYDFGASYQRVIKDHGLRLISIDDNGDLSHYYADIVLNQNLHARENLYADRDPCTQLLLGTRFVLLRREFLKWRGWRREIPRVAQKLLVTFGGADPDNVTLKVIRALQLVEATNLEVVVAVGAGNPHYEELQSAIQKLRFPARLERNATDMPGLMAWADVAVSSAGTTSWELAFMGLPSLILALSANQYPVAEALEMKGVAVNLARNGNPSSSEIATDTTALLGAEKERREMARRGQSLVDGRGTNRILMHVKGKEIKLRAVSEEDCKLLWEWANSPEVRAASFSSEIIPWEQHAEWFRSKLSDPHCIMYVATNGQGAPIGQIRYDIRDKEAVVSVSIDRKLRGMGYGSTLIYLSSQKLRHVSDVATIHAYVKPHNEKSIRAFEKAGFQNAGTTTVHKYQAIHLLLRKEELTS